MAQLSTLGIMDTPPITQSKIGTKVWDFVFGIFLVGGAPLATYWLLATLTDWPCSLVYRHYGDRPAFILQMVTLTVAMLAAIPAFIFAILWRTRHRTLPAWAVGFVVVIAIILAFFFFGFIALCYGPNDDWNH